MNNLILPKAEFYQAIQIFFFDPRLKINRITSVLITINKLALVKEISMFPILISGPIL